MPAQPEQRRLGGLDTLVLRGAGPGPGLVVVMCHGFGADAWDLLPLAQVVAAPPGTTWLFPHAPLEVPLGPHVTGRAWFPIDMVALQLAMMAGRHRDLSGERPPALAEAQRQITALVAELGVPWDHVVLAGFSQGGMVATALALHGDEAPAGLAILSGTLLDAEAWTQLAPRRAGLRFFQSHGTHDPLLDVAAARRLHRVLTEAGWHGEYVEFRGQHEIPQEVVDRLGAYLRSVGARLQADVTAEQP